MANLKEEAFDPGALCDGSEEDYDGLAVESNPYDNSKFEVPDDFVVGDEDD